jgi:hypothetical protein
MRRISGVLGYLIAWITYLLLAAAGVVGLLLIIQAIVRIATHR